MAYPIFVSPPSSKGFSGAIKYVEYNGEEPAESEYIKSENPFILKCLASGPDDKILDKLMIVKFNDSSEEEIKEILLNKGIECEGRRYYFLGHSDEQLKKKTCYVMTSTQEEIQALHSQLTDFSRKISVADRAREFGAWFSDCRFSLKLEEKELKFTNTPEHCDNTGICGFMSESFSQQIQMHRNLAHAPSAIRIIHENCNGWLLRNDSLKAPIKVYIYKSTTRRKSIGELPKSSHPIRNVLGVQDIVRPYSMGYLDAKTVMLLAGKGVPVSYMETLQKTFYDILNRLEENRTHTLFFLNMTGNKDLHGKVQEAGLTEEIKTQLKVIKEEEIRKMTSSQSSLRVLVPHAREVLGFPDPYSQLRNGELFFDPTLPDGSPEQVEFKKASKLLVIPCPCYHPEEVSVLNLAKDIYLDYKNLKDCLVFPSESTFYRKNSEKQHKTYFVTWDPTLIPPSQSWSFTHVRTWLSRYPRMSISSHQTKASPEKRRFQFLTPKRLRPPEEKRRAEKQEKQDLVEYFASFNDFDDLLCRADEMYKKFALLKGPPCKECCQLEAILSGRMNLTKENKKAEKTIAQMEKSWESADTGEKTSVKEEGAVGMVERMEKNACEYIAKGRPNIW